MRIQKWIAAALAVSAVFLGGYGWVRTRPVCFDAGGCGGGYATHLCQKYGEALLDRYLVESGIASAEIVPGSYTVDYEGRTLRLGMDVTYSHNTHGQVTESIVFTGKRVWMETFDWEPGVVVEKGAARS